MLQSELIRKICPLTLEYQSRSVGSNLTAGWPERRRREGRNAACRGVGRTPSLHPI